jgi:hypothetical protein
MRGMIYMASGRGETVAPGQRLNYGQTVDSL